MVLLSIKPYQGSNLNGSDSNVSFYSSDFNNFQNSLSVGLYALHFKFLYEVFCWNFIISLEINHWSLDSLDFYLDLTNYFEELFGFPAIYTVYYIRFNKNCSWYSW